MLYHGFCLGQDLLFEKVSLEIDRGGTYILVAWWGILEAMTV